MPREDLIQVKHTPKVVISLDPVRSILSSMGMLAGCHDIQGLNNFIVQTYQQLTREQLLEHQVLFLGLHYAIQPAQTFPEFENYLEYLKKVDPSLLVDQLFSNYAKNVTYKEQGSDAIINDVSREEQQTILKSRVSYFEYLSRGFDEACLDFNIEAKAYKYLLDPANMVDAIVNHLEFLWETYFKTEWIKNKPILENAVSSYNQLNFPQTDPIDAVKQITGRDLSEEWADPPWKLNMIRELRLFVFIPSLHIGPYLGKGIYNNTLYVNFSPRAIQGVEFTSTELTHNDISVRLNTLSDPIRLKILKAVSQAQEMSSKEIMTTFNLSQSATSRHLKMLSATGFLSERRQNSAKIYAIEKKVITETLDAVSTYLLEN